MPKARHYVVIHRFHSIETGKYHNPKQVIELKDGEKALKAGLVRFHDEESDGPVPEPGSQPDNLNAGDQNPGAGEPRRSEDSEAGEDGEGAGEALEDQIDTTGEPGTPQEPADREIEAQNKARAAPTFGNKGPKKGK